MWRSQVTDKFPELESLKLAVALPSYNGTRHNGVPLMYLSRQVPQFAPIATQSSLLAMVFNITLATAMKWRDAGHATHYLMLHDDIVPTSQNWFEELWGAYKASNAQLICAVSPIKDARGLTSIAVETEGGVMKPRRLTMREIDKGPVTFTMPGLLLNTGCMLFDLREPWVDDCYFHIDDKIHWVDGVPHPQSASEDWNFTRMARAAGCERIYATSAMPLEHVGQARFPNHGAWGSLEQDDGS
jgi:hypothetical protein